MRFRGFLFLKDFSWIYLIPSIEVVLNEPQYRNKSIKLMVHWIGWHFRWLWIEKDKE